MTRIASPLPRHRDVLLRTNFWVVPLTLSGLALTLAVGAVIADHNLSTTFSDLPPALRLTTDDARTVLATITGASITVVALVVSVTMVVLSLASTAFGPRIVRNFIRRRSTQLTIGAFVATFVYALTVLTSVFSASQGGFVPLLSTWLAVIWGLASIALLVWWVHDLAFSIQMGNLIVSIAGDLYRAIDLQQATVDRLSAATGPLPSPGSTAEAVSCPVSGYVQMIDYEGLARLATRAGAVVYLRQRAGDFVLSGTPIALVEPAACGAMVGPEVLRALTIGAYRTLEQDLEYAIAQLVEIALRALSPAVNDPFTAMMCIDWLADAIQRIERAPVRIRGVTDADGTVRVVARPNDTGTLIDSAFDQLRQVGAGQPAVAVRLLASIARLLPAAGEIRRDHLRVQADMLLAGAEANGLVSKDLDAIRAAHHQAVSAQL